MVTSCVGLTTEHTDLMAAISALAAQAAPTALTREHFDLSARGVRPPIWDKLCRQGIPAIHLPAEYGGGGAGIVEVAVALDAAAHGLIPGPLLPTVTAGALVDRHGSPAARDDLLTRFAGGATGACALDATGPVATTADGGLRVSGLSGPILGGMGADILVLGASGPEGPVWFAVPPDSPGITRVPVPGVDLTRDLGRLELDGLAVPDDHVLSCSTHHVRGLAAVLFSAEAVGIARWCLDTAVAYAKVREQFGRPIGSFQAVKHKCAQLFLRVELLAAAAWDGACAADEDRPDGPQSALAAARAAVQCLPEAAGIALDSLTVLGGIGNTWDHDLHLYWRRATGLFTLLGPHRGWSYRAGELALTTERAPAVGVEDRPELRAEVAAAIAEATDPDNSDGRTARRILAGHGLVAPHYPPPYGRAADAAEQVIIAEEFRRAGMAQPTTVIGEWALPTILQHGTVAQRERLVGPTLRGEIEWCQLFSEPGAGSDLAAVRTFAEKVGGGWCLNGQKVWTSHAREAHWAVCLARTDRSAAKRSGISYFLIDMSTPGIEVRPLREANGESMFNEVFLDDVFVPDDCLVGAAGDGWRLARTTLGNERIAMGSGAVGARIRLDPVAAVVELPAAARAAALPALGTVTATSGALDALGRRALRKRISGLEPGAEGNVLKYLSAQHQVELARTMIEWAGPAAAQASGEAGRTLAAYLSTPAMLIGGGTAEIQLNIIGERILGLPRERTQ